MINEEKIVLAGQAGYVCNETSGVVARTTEPTRHLNELDSLVQELKSKGIWGRVGEIRWARDTRDGVLIEWVPSNLNDHSQTEKATKKND